MSSQDTDSSNVKLFRELFSFTDEFTDRQAIILVFQEYIRMQIQLENTLKLEKKDE